MKNLVPSSVQCFPTTGCHGIQGCRKLKPRGAAKHRIFIKFLESLVKLVNNEHQGFLNVVV